MKVRTRACSCVSFSNVLIVTSTIVAQGTAVGCGLEEGQSEDQPVRQLLLDPPDNLPTRDEGSLL
jgi:hypothetical protein